MSVPVLTLFNNKGGVGKTSLIYHLAWMFAELGRRVVAVDLDPQANLTAAFLEEDHIDSIWQDSSAGSHIYSCLEPLTGVGDIAEPRLECIAREYGSGTLHLLPGSVSLSAFEDTLSGEWSDSFGDRNLYRPMRILSAFWQIVQMAAQKVDANLILVDIGPNLGAINRSALIATDYVVIPLGADLFSLQGLKNLGPALRNWRSGWDKRLDNWWKNAEHTKYAEFALPEGKMQPLGYLCQQYGIRLTRPVRAYDRWVKRIPQVYREAVLDQSDARAPTRQEDDPHCLAMIKHYRSLMPMAQELRKPIFKLTTADGALGSHSNAARDAARDFEQLAQEIVGRF